MTGSGFSKQDATASGLFFFGHAYWASASALELVKVDSGHRESPVNYLYFHALELLLKSYLLHNGATHDQLRKEFSHKLLKTAKKAHSLGLDVLPGDFETLKLCDQNYIEARYLRTGPFKRPRPENLWGICSVWYEQIGDVLKDAGEVSYMYDRPDYLYDHEISVSVEEAVKLLTNREDDAS